MKVYPRYHKTVNEINLILLQNYCNSGSVCPDMTLEKIIMIQRAKIIREHEEKHSIWQNKTTMKWCTKLGAEKRLIMRKERSDLENAIIEFYLADEKLTATVNDVFQDWCQYESEHDNYSMKTINEYTNDYRRFLAQTDFASYPIHNVTERDIVRLLRAIVHDGEKIPPKRYAAVKTVIRTLFNHARIYMEIDCISVKNIMDDLRFPSTAFKDTNKDNDTQVFKHSELSRIKNALKDTDNLLELGILLTIETGVRVGELCTIKRDCITEDHLLIRYSEHKARFKDGFRYYVDAPKKGKSRNVVLNPDAKRIIKKILSLHDSEWLFPSKEDDAVWMHSYYFDKAIRAVCRRLGINERSMHKLRKTYASFILNSKDEQDNPVPEKLVQVQLGHADISTTQQSYHYDIFDTDEKVKILGSIKID